MTRQIALGAVIAFGVTVLALSVWEPKPPPAVAPAQTLVPAVAPVVVAPRYLKPFRPATLRPESINRIALQPMIQQWQVIDAGAPVP